MIDMTKITKILDLFLHFNYVEGSDSLNFEYNQYTDKFFRWTKETFNHHEKFCVVFSDVSIKMFDRVKVSERIKANINKVKASPDGHNFGCSMDVILDLVMTIPITPMTEQDFLDIEVSTKRIEAYQEEAAQAIIDESNKPDYKKMGTGYTKGSKLTNNVE